MAKYKRVDQLPQQEEDAVETIEQDDQPTGEALIIREFQTPVALAFPSYEQALEVLNKKREEYKNLPVTDINDKEGIKKVEAAHAELKRSRIALVKSAKETVIGPAKQHLEDFISNLEKIEAEFKDIEKPLMDNKKWIQEEKAAAKVREEERQIKLMLDRVNELNKYGAVADGNHYNFSYTTLWISVTALKEFDDDKFNTFRDELVNDWNFEQERLAEEKRKEEEAAAEAKRIVDANRDRAFKLRERELTKLLGFFREDGAFMHKTIDWLSLTVEHVDCMTDEEWDAFVEKTENEIENLSQAPDPVELDIDGDEPIPVIGSSAGQVLTEMIAEPLPENINLDFVDENSAPELPILPVEQKEEVVLTFTNDKPYSDIDFSEKWNIRVTVLQFADVAFEGVEVAKKGTWGEMVYAVIGK